MERSDRMVKHIPYKNRGPKQRPGKRDKNHQVKSFGWFQSKRPQTIPNKKVLPPRHHPPQHLKRRQGVPQQLSPPHKPYKSPPKPYKAPPKPPPNRQGVPQVLAPPHKPYKTPPPKVRFKPTVRPIPRNRYRPAPPAPLGPPPAAPSSYSYGAPSYQYQYLPPVEPTPYQVRMSSPAVPINSRTAFITG